MDADVTIGHRIELAAFTFLLLGITAPGVEIDAQEAVTTPVEHFGHEIGADYRLAGYEELERYWEILARQSDRMALDTIGFTAEGRAQLMAILTSPENHANLSRFREISERMTRAEGLGEAEARALAQEGRAIVWIDGGLHANEVLGAQQLIELVYRMASLEDAETLRLLDDVILLAAHANPDGHALVADWYMRRSDPRRRTTFGLPTLYQKYAGHDNNRDFYMSNLAETKNVNRVLYREWYPQIVYNHHQTGPTGAIMFAPPFRDPANHYLDPLMLTSIQEVGASMHQRFVEEGKGGTTMRSGASYSTWWNGGLRTTPYFHNMIGILTEAQGHPTPISIPFVPERQRATNSDLPLPVEPTSIWHFRQSVEYSQTANRAVLDYASRNSDRLLLNAWRMGTNSIERGSRDHWTVLPGEIDRASEVLGGSAARAGRMEWNGLLRAPEDRDARAFVLPADQNDFGTARKFVNALLETGVEVHRASSAFSHGGREYPEGSYVVRSAQAFRPHVLDMFEPQDYPDDFQYPGGPPIAPYDNAGWTLAYQMGVEFDRILDALEAPLVRIEDVVPRPEGRIVGEAAIDGEVAGWSFDHRQNDAFLAVNRLLDDGREVFWVEDRQVLRGDTLRPGAFFVAQGDGARAAVEAAASTAGVDARALARAPGGEALRLRPVRIGLADEYGGSIASGWTRFVLDSFGFDYDLVFPRDLDDPNLSRSYDVLVFPDGIVPPVGSRGGSYGQPRAEDIPEQWRDRLGSVTADRTVPAILEFAREGGAVIAVGSSTSLAYHAELPVREWLLDPTGRRIPPDEHYVPGSVLEVALEDTTPVTHGLRPRADVLFSRSPVFDLMPGSEEQGLVRFGWFDSDAPLRSGWAWHQELLENATTMLEAPVGDGTLFLFGPDITFRGQSHGTFPLLFNAMLYGPADRTALP